MCAVRTTASCLSQVQTVPHLFSKYVLGRFDSRCKEGQLVGSGNSLQAKRNTSDDDRPDCRHADSDSQRRANRAAVCRYAHFHKQGSTGGSPCNVKGSSGTSKSWITEHRKRPCESNLKYGPNGERVIQVIDRVSKPGCRVYVRSQEMQDVRDGLGVSILSTSKGVLSNREAKAQGVGGEVICNVW